MQKRATILLPTALFFLVLCLILLTSGSSVGVTVSRYGLEQAGTFLQQVSFSILAFVPRGGNKQQDEILTGIANKAKDATQKQEMQALRDQFETSTIPQTSLLPAKIIGFEGFLPGVSRPTQVVLDRGGEEGVSSGLAVIYKNNLVGKVVKTTDHRSLVALLTKSGWSFTVKTSSTNANGLVEIDNGDIFLKNVVLSDSLEKGDLIVTKGDETMGNGGFPPDIVVGKVASIDKKASALFQTAKVKSLQNVVSLTTVFIFLPKL